MHSDNGTNFVGASKVLKIEFREFLRNVGSEINTNFGPQGIFIFFLIGILTPLAHLIWMAFGKQVSRVLSTILGELLVG